MEDEVTCTAALLHDVVEDTDVTFEDLAEMGFTPEVIRIVRLLTHDPEVPYMDYVRRIKEDPQAVKVKLSDLRHNSDLTRIDHVAQRDLDRVKKYKAAIELLLSKD